MDIVEEVFSGKQWVAVYGVGYVGLSLIAVYLRKGMRVIGVDIDEKKLEALSHGEFWFNEETIREAIKEGLRENRLILTTDGIEASKNSGVKVVTVPVYIDWDSKEISYHAIEDVSKKIGRGLKKEDLVIVESSVPPGTTENIVKPLLENESGLKADKDFYLAYSPERIYVGRAVKDIEENYPKIIGGIGPRSLEVASRFYEKIARKGVVKVSSTRVAEFEKLAEGIYRDVNIALANELALASMKLGINYYEVREAANTQPYCHLHLPGPGVGGYCIPLYPYFAMNVLMNKGFVMELTRLARKINEDMPYSIVKLIEYHRRKIKLPLHNIKVAVLGIAFRGDIDDTRLSPSLDIIALLKARGYKNIIAHDPCVFREPVLEDLNIKLTNNLDEALNEADIVIVLTRHSMYKMLKVSSILDMTGRKSLIIDAIGYVLNDIRYDRIVVLGIG